MTDLSRKGDRKELAIRREPHWHKLDLRAYLGFRRGPDTWIARFRERSGKQAYNALNVSSTCRDPFVEAKRLATEWFAQMDGASSTAKRGTVRDAIDAYLTSLQRLGRTDASTTARARFKVIVPAPDPLGALRLEDAKREDFEAWRDRLLPGRIVRSVNRYTGALAAALNAALELGHVGDARAWNLPLLTDDSAHDERTAVFLQPQQRKALLAHAGAAAADFFHGLELTGARPGELARASVADFDGEQIRFTHRKGRPPKLRTRYTVLSAEGVEFFKRMAKGKAADAPLVGNPDGVNWERNWWAEALRTALKRYHKKCKPSDRLPAGVSAYAFRHSRISELLQVHGIDPLTVAVQTGTSLMQIEKVYYKFIASAMRAKLAAVREST
ncbi:MAG: site-specific integrase [Gammaproteobacteria bacterium]